MDVEFFLSSFGAFAAISLIFTSLFIKPVREGRLFLTQMDDAGVYRRIFAGAFQASLALLAFGLLASESFASGPLENRRGLALLALALLFASNNGQRIS